MAPQTPLQEAFNQIGTLNTALRERADRINTTGGSSNFNLALINKMSSLDGDHSMRKESQYRLGWSAVNWHADSCLEDFSTIAVYQHLTAPHSQRNKKPTQHWRVAMRVVRDAEGPGRVLKVPCKNTIKHADCVYV